MISILDVGLALATWILPVVYLALSSFAGTILVRIWPATTWPDRLALGGLSAGAALWAFFAGVWIATTAYSAVGRMQSFGWAFLEMVLAVAAIHVVRRAYLDRGFAASLHDDSREGTTRILAPSLRQSASSVRDR